MANAHENILDNLNILKLGFMQAGKGAHVALCEIIIPSLVELGADDRRLVDIGQSVQLCLEGFTEGRRLEQNYGDVVSFDALYTELYAALMGVLYTSRIPTEAGVLVVGEPEQEAEVNWEEFSISGHDSDSGYAGSTSDLSEVSIYSSITEELRHNEQCHFGFLLQMEHVREADEIQVPLEADNRRVPCGFQRADILNWLKDSDPFVSDRKRKLEDEDAADDNKRDGNKKRKLLKGVRRIRSDTCLSTENGLVKNGMKSSSCICLSGT